MMQSDWLSYLSTISHFSSRQFFSIRLSNRAIKLAYLPSKFRFSGKYFCFKNIKFAHGNYQLIVPRQKHSIV